MIRSYSAAVGPSIAQIAGNCYGIAVWPGTAGSSAFPLVATVDGPSGSESVLLRAGTYYQFADQVSGVEVVTADGSSGTVAVDVARAPADFVNLAGATSSDPRSSAPFAAATIAVGATYDSGIVTTPAGARGMMIVMDHPGIVSLVAQPSVRVAAVTEAGLEVPFYASIVTVSGVSDRYTRHMVGCGWTPVIASTDPWYSAGSWGNTSAATCQPTTGLPRRIRITTYGALSAGIGQTTISGIYL